MDEKEILKVNDVAKILGVHETSVQKWLMAGDFPQAYKLNPSRPKSPWRVPRTDVAAFIERRRKERGFIRLPM